MVDLPIEPGAIWRKKRPLPVRRGQRLAGDRSCYRLLPAKPVVVAVEAAAVEAIAVEAMLVKAREVGALMEVAVANANALEVPAARIPHAANLIRRHPYITRSGARRDISRRHAHKNPHRSVGRSRARHQPANCHCRTQHQFLHAHHRTSVPAGTRFGIPARLCFPLSRLRSFCLPGTRRLRTVQTLPYEKVAG